MQTQTTLSPVVTQLWIDGYRRGLIGQLVASEYAQGGYNYQAGWRAGNARFEQNQEAQNG